VVTFSRIFLKFSNENENKERNFGRIITVMSGIIPDKINSLAFLLEILNVLVFYCNLE